MDRIVDYDSLATAIRNLVDLEIGDSVDGYLQFVEADVGRRMNTKWQEVTESLAVTQAGLVFDTDRRSIMRMVIDQRPLEELSEHTAHQQYLNATPARPRAYSVAGGQSPITGVQKVSFWPRPPDDTTYTVDVSYKLIVPPLATATPTTWLLSAAPDVYLYGAAIHAVTFNGDATNLELYQGAYAQAVSGLFDEVEKHLALEETVSAPGGGGYEMNLP